MPRRRFVILDRDGTINVDRHFLADPAGFELIGGAAEGLRRLAKLGLGLVVATNQSGIGRGYFAGDDLEAIHGEMAHQLAELGVRLDGVYTCPHRPEDECDCRKPRTGLMERAAAELSFDPSEAFVVGDRPRDIEMGRAVGATTLLVRTGHGARFEREGRIDPDYVVDDLREAAEVIARLLEATH
jgi:D-glycero-D-manno-heptose 1,7-bisphosphate phosphatase